MQHQESDCGVEGPCAHDKQLDCVWIALECVSASEDQARAAGEQVRCPGSKGPALAARALLS